MPALPIRAALAICLCLLMPLPANAQTAPTEVCSWTQGKDAALCQSIWPRFSPDQQTEILSQIASGTPAQTAITTVAAPNVPFGLHEAIMAEAAANGADSDFDLPAFEEELVELLQTGNITTSGFDGLVSYAPEAIVQLPIYIRAEAAQGRLVDAQGRLVDAQAIGSHLDAITNQLVNPAAAENTP